MKNYWFSVEKLIYSKIIYGENIKFYTIFDLWQNLEKKLRKQKNHKLRATVNKRKKKTNKLNPQQNGPMNFWRRNTDSENLHSEICIWYWNKKDWRYSTNLKFWSCKLTLNVSKYSHLKFLNIAHDFHVIIGCTNGSLKSKLFISNII